MLRRWQSECVESALEKYNAGQKHFLCLATPGAGKTKMAAEVAARLREQKSIDIILCFSPSLSVAAGIQQTFSRRLDCSFNGSMGAIGSSYTYQSMLYLKDDFWKSINKYRVLVVFDEIHHCAGSSLKDANAWGEEIITKIQDKAKYTLALTGTPWRSDSTPIVLSQYSGQSGKILCDFTYGLREAVQDRVCRSPNIVLVDNDKLTIKKEDKCTKVYSSIPEFLKESTMSYQSIITHRDAMKHVLRIGCQKLNNIRRENPRAGGLVVASSVEHANKIAMLLRDEFYQTTTVVTYRHDNPLDEIALFRRGKTQWIVSVGMISEGTDIPRLQVCCHLSTVKTELYFRQVLGRILRFNDVPNQEAWLYTIAEPKLTEFAERIAVDIPEDNVIKEACSSSTVEASPECNNKERLSTSLRNLAISTKDTNQLEWGYENTGSSSNLMLSDLDLLGHFRERLLRAF